MMALGVQRTQHAISCAQHPVFMAISLTEGRYGRSNFCKDVHRDDVIKQVHFHIPQSLFCCTIHAFAA